MFRRLKRFIIWYWIVIIGMTIWGYNMKHTNRNSIVPPEKNTSTHYYGTPKPDPAREISHYDWEKRRFIYKDETAEKKVNIDSIPKRPYNPANYKHTGELEDKAEEYIQDNPEVLTDDY